MAYEIRIQDGPEVHCDASAPGWLVREYAEDLAIEHTGSKVELFEDGALQATYRNDPEDGMEIER